jgi:hypothetical protein
MKRLILSLLLGVLCLVLLAIPANAGLYDPHNPPPTPYININDDLNNSDIGWDGPVQSDMGDQNIDQPMTDPSESVTVSNTNASTSESRTGRTFKRFILSVLLPKTLRW